MSGPNAIKYLTATGEVDTAGNARILYALVVTGGSAQTTATLRSGGATGDILMLVQAAVNTTVNVPIACGAAFPKGIHVTIAQGAGTGAAVSVVYS